MTTTAAPNSQATATPLRADKSSPEPVLLIIADISGYTRYMTANAKTLSHSQAIITELVEAIIHEIRLPLEVAKLEGDAVFLFSRKNALDHSWPETRRVISEKLLTFFLKFGAKIRELSESTACTCNACTHIEKLRLKIVVHSGEALFHRVHSFLELAGVDVIIVHRLLKNSVEVDQYLLLTESAHRDLEFSEPIPLVESSEDYDDIGRIKTLIYLPEAARSALALDHHTPEKILPVAAVTPFRRRFAAAWKQYWKLWFAPLRWSSAAKVNEFHHIEAGASAGNRIGLAVFTAALTPFMLLVGPLFILRHAMLPRLANHAAHPTDCACVRH